VRVKLTFAAPQQNSMPPQPVRPPSQMQGGSQGPPQGPRSLASAAPNIGPAGASDQEKVAGPESCVAGLQWVFAGGVDHASVATVR
jgi:hypothetical protein